MSEAIASESRPALPSEPSRVFASHVQNIKEDVICAEAQFCSTFPTDQVPQPVPRDTIVLTTMAAPTDSRGAACLPQSAPTVQAQVSSTGCVTSCDDCTHVTLQHNHVGAVNDACPAEARGARAGPRAYPSPPSVIPSSSCPAVVSSRPNTVMNQVSDLAEYNTETITTSTPIPSTATDCPQSSESLDIFLPSSGGSSNLKYNNKMQSVNVNCSLAANNVSIDYKGNDTSLMKTTAVTVPKTEPQRNSVQFDDRLSMVWLRSMPHANNNSIKSLEIVNVNVKNVNKHGALIPFPNNKTYNNDNICRTRRTEIPDNDIPVVVLSPTVQGIKYSNYYPPTFSFKRETSEIDYASIESDTMSDLNIRSENKPLATNVAQCSFEQLILEQRGSAERERTWAAVMRRPIGLRGGGESSLNAGTAGWGTPPAPSANNNNGNNSSGWGSNPASQNANSQSNWNNNPARNNSTGPGQGPPTTQDGNTNKTNNQNANQQQNQNQPPTSQSSNNQGWNQNNSGNKPSGNTNNQTGTNQGSSSTNANTGNTQSTNSQGNNATTSTKQQIEQLNSLRESLFSQDGWGGQHVNQDTNWDIPSSPEPGQKGDGSSGAPLWKPPVNNGTELWEANLRNGGQPPPQPVQKTPWGHTPTTNIGGTWGEDDDVSDSSNVWTGVPSNPQQWGAAGGNANTGMWGEKKCIVAAGPKKDNDWGAASGGGSGWGDPRDPRTAAMDPRDAMRASSMDPRSAAAAAAAAAAAVGDPRDSMRILAGGDPMRDGIRDPRDIRALADMRGDPRGITGRLNGDAMWGAPPQPPHHMGHHQPPGKMVGPAPNGVNQWAGPPPKDMGMGSKPTGWEEPSPPSQRRNMPNFDDGTSLWGNPNQQQSRMNTSGKLSHWTDMPAGGPMGGRGGACPPGMVGGAGRKPTDTPLWGRNGSWGDETTAHWGDDGWGKPKAPVSAAPWDAEIDWHKQQGPGLKPITKEIVWGSKQFRTLVEMGYKKEDVENALRMREMNVDEALDMLNPSIRPGVESWRGGTASSAAMQGRHDDHAPYDHTGGAGPYGAQRFGPGGPGQLQFPPGGNAPNIMNNMGGSGGNPSLASIGNMSPAVVQKMLTGGGAGGVGVGAASAQVYGTAGAPGRTQPQQAPQSQPSTQQLRMLVQQIQLAVQAGYLNHQILNQPLAPQTLILLNQLLQNIKLLQTLMQQHSMLQTPGSLGVSKPNSQGLLQISVQITKTKQQINNLQNQIAVNQAHYVKQQMGGGGGAGPSDFFKAPNVHDPITALPTNFTDLSINKEPSSSYNSNHNQSRLTQWIKSDKEDVTGVEFSRAPGSVTKPPAPHASPSMNLLGQTDGPWSTGRSADASGWPDTGTDGPDVTAKDTWPSTQASPATFTDLVPEFEPGKPWKGNQMKSIEDDPSITPGSVVRSPLALATIKDTEIFNAAPPSSVTQQSKASPPGGDPLQSLSLSSSTWSFNPPASTTSAFTSPLSKLGSSKGTWGDAPPPTAVTSELWGAPMSKSRGPPPGLVVKGSSLNATNNNTANGWGGLGVRSGTTAASWGTGNWGSSWLLLRNLTAQIDGSTLQTLCKQHGPLQNFHLHLNHGFALAKYSSREEAIKAQTALNNCVLSNTTILAESPADTEVATLLQNLSQQSGSSGGGWRGGKTAPVAGGAGSDAWGNACWPPNATATASLWGAAPSTMDSEAQRATPSSLNSYLPGDLLGGESM